MPRLLLCSLALAFVCRPAFAYIDPGSGHIIWQVLLSLAAGAAFTFRRFLRWRPGKKIEAKTEPPPAQTVDTPDAPRRSAK